jgi:steroid delta-isomerase-like uncharacterized protein
VADYRQAMRQIYDLVNDDQLDRAEELIDRDVIEHEDLPVPPGTTGVDAFKETFRALRRGFPDLRVTPEFMVAEGDKVVTYARLTGTHTGEFLGTPASNKAVEVDIIDIVRFEGDKAKEHWGLTDNAKLFQQLGLGPPPGA